MAVFSLASVRVAKLCRWTYSTIEALHHLRDVTLREDASKIRTGSAPRVMASLRNTALGLADLIGWPRLAAAVGHYRSRPDHALDLIDPRI